MVLFLAVMAVQAGMTIPVDGLEGGELVLRQRDGAEYDIALALDGERISDWFVYPLYFNPAKTYCLYEPEESILEIQSQKPYTFDYTFACFFVDENWNLTLSSQGESDYYGETCSEIKLLLYSGEFNEAYIAAREIMYPGAMPCAAELCAEFTVAAYGIGTVDAYEHARNVSLYLLGNEIYEIPCDSPEFISALEGYADISSPETAALVRERIDSFE